MATISAHVKCWFQNLPSTPQRVMARYLRRRGWVAFYLEDHSRDCNGGTCWMELYNQSERPLSAQRHKMASFYTNSSADGR